MKLTMSLVAAAALAATTVATAAPQAMQAARADNAHATAALERRIATVEARIASGRRSGKVTRAQGARLLRQVAWIRASMSSLGRRQGFVSAAEIASYERSLGEVDIALDGDGVPRSYGDDALVAPGGVDGSAIFRYDCRNEPLAIAIPGQRLDRALAQLRRATHCPISGTELAAGRRSRPVHGTMTPASALRTMLGGTGLAGRSIKRGFQVTRSRRPVP